MSVSLRILSSYFLFLLCGYASATVTISTEFLATPGLPGFTTVEFIAHTDIGWDTSSVPGVGVTEVVSGSDIQITGMLNQIHPLGIQTPFINASIDDLMEGMGINARHDSRFSFPIPYQFLQPAIDTTRELSVPFFKIHSESGFGNEVRFARVIVPVGRSLDAIFNGGHITLNISGALADLDGFSDFSPGPFENSIGIRVPAVGEIPPTPALLNPTVTTLHSEEGFSIVAESIPTPGLEGFTTFQLFVHSSREIEALFIDSNGSMNQINPFRRNTVLEDTNGLLVMTENGLLQDSHLTILSEGDDAIARPDGIFLDTQNRESDTSLTAQLVTRVPGQVFGSDFRFAQYVLPNGSELDLSMSAYLITPGMGFPLSDVRSFTGTLRAPTGVPEPSSFVLAMSVLLGIAVVSGDR